ncbi:coagulogen-like isoform X2 [Limulus polyphemus]|uniref:Coagulogen-like isoform X2 n=1 Tax=Limulus polyphemus TaxID=6850 RepID=A0ABM1C1M3_LIMPO|nr:coagulogen-like isoform X2 [Limulus polyphemus]
MSTSLLILLPLLQLLYITSADINQPECLCEEPIGPQGRKKTTTYISFEIQRKIDREIEKLQKSLGKEKRSLNLLQWCGHHNCYVSPDEDRCYYSALFYGADLSQCKVALDRCEPVFAYTVDGNFRIIVQSQEKDLHQCVWQFKCRDASNSNCTNTGVSCGHQRRKVGLLSYNLEFETIQCEDFYQCCDCRCKP